MMRMQMNSINSEGHEMAYKALTINKWEVAGHGGMVLGRLGIRQIWCETRLLCLPASCEIWGKIINLSGLSVDISGREIITPALHVVISC